MLMSPRQVTSRRAAAPWHRDIVGYVGKLWNRGNQRGSHVQQSLAQSKCWHTSVLL